MALRCNIKVAIFAAYVFSWVLVFSLVHLSGQSGQPAYNVTVAVLLTELLKLAMSLALYVAQDGWPSELRRAVLDGGRQHLIPLACPTLLYAVGNNLSYLSLARLDPGTYMLLMQARVALTAYGHNLVFARRLHHMQWVAIFLIMFGCICNEADKLGSVTGRTASSAAWLTISVQICCSVAAGVWNEKMLKCDAAQLGVTANLKNAAMYVHGIILNGGWLLVRSSFGEALSVASVRIFFSSPLLLAVVAFTAVASLTTALFLRHLDSVLKTAANGLEVVLMVIVSCVFFEVPIMAQNLLGVTTITIGVIIYSTLESLRLSPTTWMASTYDRPRWRCVLLVGLLGFAPAVAQLIHDPAPRAARMPPPPPTTTITPPPSPLPSPLPSCKITAWPPRLFSNPSTFGQAARGALTKLRHAFEAYPKCAIGYLQSGATLGLYRDGGPIHNDSDIDIRIVVNDDCSNSLWLQTHIMKMKAGRVSLNFYQEWGDFVNGYGYPPTHGKANVSRALFARIRSQLCVREIDASGFQFVVHQKQPLQFAILNEYGPAWFVPLPFHGIYTDHAKRWRMNSGVTPAIKTLIHSAADWDTVEITPAEVETYMISRGLNQTAYHATVSARDQCRAAKFLTWWIRHDIRRDVQINHAVEPSATLLGRSPMFAFPECGNARCMPRPNVLPRDTRPSPGKQTSQ